jgi:hypothetical protein
MEFLRFLTDSLRRFLVKFKEPVLNSLSDGAEEAGMHKKILATRDNRGNLYSLRAHHPNISMDDGNGSHVSDVCFSIGILPFRYMFNSRSIYPLIRLSMSMLSSS